MWLNQSKDLSFDDIEIDGKNLQEEIVEQEPEIYTERMSAEPKVVTERIIGEPKVIQENLVEPLRQRIIISPVVNQQVEQIEPDFRQQRDQFVERNAETLPTKFTLKRNEKNVYIDGNQTFKKVVVEPKVHKVKEVLQLEEGGEVRETLDPVSKPAQVETRVQKRRIVVPANRFVNQPVLQPIFERDNV